MNKVIKNNTSEFFNVLTIEGKRFIEVPNFICEKHEQ